MNCGLSDIGTVFVFLYSLLSGFLYRIRLVPTSFCLFFMSIESIDTVGRLYDVCVNVILIVTRLVPIIG